MRPLALALALALSGIVSVSGAYVETRDCAGAYTIQGLQAALDHYRDGQQRLSFNISDTYGRENRSCQIGDQKEAQARLQLESLSRVEKRNVTSITYSCSKEGWASFSFEVEIAQPRFLDALFMTVNLYDTDDQSLGCVTAHLTPEVSSKLIAIMTWIPAIALISAVTAAIWREVKKPSGGEAEEHGHLVREASRAHVTRVTDCLGYIQFVFLSSALSLYYPGFLQPMTSTSSWSTLMFPTGIIQRRSYYIGTQDGLYQTNGTMSGTAGLELMTQIAGGTQGFDNWLNIISLAALIFVILVGMAYFGARLEWTRDWFQSTHSLIFRNDSLGQGFLKDVLWVATRLFCACLLLPMVAWTTYQLIHLDQIPPHQVVGATLSICLMAILLLWAMQYFRPRNMGYLLMDNFKEHHDFSTLSRKQDLYSTSVYVALTVRGVVHGGLERIGSVQLMILLGVEVIHATLQAFVYKIIPVSTRSGSMPLLRLLILALQCAFVTGVAGHRSKIAIGLVILCVHTLVLLGLFLIPAVLDVAALMMGAISTVLAKRKSQQPPVYSLRRLNNRPTTPPHPTLPQMLSDAPAGYWDTEYLQAPSPVSYQAPTLPSRTPSPASDTRTYFRPPRSSSAALISQASMARLQFSYPADGSCGDIGQPVQYSQAGSSSSPHSNGGDESSEWSPTASESDSNSITPNAASLIQPMADYSVREADLYYKAPRRLSFNQASKEGKRKGAAVTWRFWSKM